MGNSAIKINMYSRRELTFSKYTQWLRMNDRNVYADKMRATNHADEIILATRDYINEGLKQARKDNIKDFARGSVLMEIGTSQYSAEVVVGFDSSGEMLLYYILKITPTVIQKRAIVPYRGNPAEMVQSLRVVYTMKSKNGNRQYSFRRATAIDGVSKAKFEEKYAKK